MVHKEPKWGILTALDPLETSILLFEFINNVKQTFDHFNERGPAFEVGPRDVAQERGELLYHLLCYVFSVH